jgi:WD repeat-containing protein 48
LTPPPSNDAPTLHLSPHISLVISEEGILGWTTIYCGTIATSFIDLRALEETMPMWLLEYLLVNKFPALKNIKLSFHMLPWPSKNPNETLPLLLNV